MTSIPLAHIDAHGLASERTAKKVCSPLEAKECESMSAAPRPRRRGKARHPRAATVPSLLNPAPFARA
jgi:hypothetical protein